MGNLRGPKDYENALRDAQHAEKLDPTSTCVEFASLSQMNPSNIGRWFSVFIFRKVFVTAADDGLIKGNCS